MYIWPTKLYVPRRPPKLVYLDLNHWISLSKANAGHRDGDQFRDVLAACIDASDRNAAEFPLSDSLYFEISKIGRYRQRRNLREVIERISKFVVVTSRTVVSVHEIETMLDARVGPSSDPINASAQSCPRMAGPNSGSGDRRFNPSSPANNLSVKGPLPRHRTSNTKVRGSPKLITSEANWQPAPV